MRKEIRCKQCGQRFTPTCGRQVYCKPCGKDHRKAKLREYSKAHSIRKYGGEKHD